MANVVLLFVRTEVFWLEHFRFDSLIVSKISLDIVFCTGWYGPQMSWCFLIYTEDMSFQRNKGEIESRIILGFQNDFKKSRAAEIRFEYHNELSNQNLNFYN